MSDIKIDIREDKIATVTLDRAPANAFTAQMYDDLASAFYELGERDDVAVIILRAAGKIFCGGNDTSAFDAFDTRTSAEVSARTCGKAVASIWDCKKPVIGAIQGACMGSGFGMAAVCDFLIAGEGVKFGIPEVSLGIPAAGCFAELVLPLHIAKYMALTGTPLAAEELQRWGVVMKVVPKEQVWAEAETFASKMAVGCYRAAGICKQFFNKNIDARLEDKFMIEQRSFMDFMLDSHDFKEAIAAYNEKRKPEFNGR